MVLWYSLGAGQCKGSCKAWIKKPGFLGWGFCVILVMLQRQVCCQVAVNFTAGPAAPKKSGQFMWYLGLCNLIFVGLACRESVSPPCVKDSGVMHSALKVDVVSLCGY